ncbi:MULTISPECIES: hypothetical protein [Campylobacter]|uniref:hypothetical protein n=1 Tax=Campylobacter TaxID=194 RepID=UPI0002ED26AC|nr:MULTISPECIES: hypothetical protein [Campylobacter]
MNIFKFYLLTTLNARAWYAVLLRVCYFLGSNPDKQTLLIITITILAVIAVISAVYIMKQFCSQAKCSIFLKARPTKTPAMTIKFNYLTTNEISENFLSNL